MFTWLEAIQGMALALSPDERLLITATRYPLTPLYIESSAVLNPAYVPPREFLIVESDTRGVPTAPPPPLPPPADAERMTPNLARQSALYIRSTQSNELAAIGEVYAGQVLLVRGSKKVWSVASKRYFTWAELLSVDGIAKVGYVALDYLKSV